MWKSRWMTPVPKLTSKICLGIDRFVADVRLEEGKSLCFFARIQEFRGATDPVVVPVPALVCWLPTKASFHFQFCKSFVQVWLGEE